MTYKSLVLEELSNENSGTPEWIRTTDLLLRRQMSARSKFFRFSSRQRY